MTIRDEFVTGTFSINYLGQKEPADWERYAKKLEVYIESIRKPVEIIEQVKESKEPAQESQPERKTIFLITTKNEDGTFTGCKPTIQIRAYWTSEGYKYTAHETEGAITLCKWPIQDLGEHCSFLENVIKPAQPERMEAKKEGILTTNGELEDLLNKLLYGQYAEDQANDYVTRIRILDEWLKEHASQSQRSVSDEEIIQAAYDAFPYDKEGIPDSHSYSFCQGAEWMRSQLSNPEPKPCSNCNKVHSMSPEECYRKTGMAT